MLLFQHFNRIICIIPILFILSSAQSGDTVSDSLQYWVLRNKIKSDTSISAILETADALAYSELYNEALEILGTLPADYKDVEVTTSKQESRVKRSNRRWRVSAGSDYYHLEDVDTATMTLAEQQEYLDLTQTPLSIWCRAGYEHSFINGVNLFPQMYVSGSRSRLEIPARILLLNDRLDVTATGKAEKWFQPAPSNADTFDISGRFDSDMAGFSLRMTPMSDQTSPNISWEIPCNLKWDHFREDRFGYESRVEYTLSPLWQIRFGPDHLQTFRLNGEIRYRDYYSKASNALDILQFVSEAAVSKRSDAGSYSIAGMWFLDQYTNKNKLSSVNRWEMRVRSEKLLGNSLLPQLSIRTIHEIERHNPEIDTTNVSVLKGTELQAQPSLKISIRELFFLQPEFIYEKRTGKKGKRLWQERSVLEPGLRIGLTSQKYDFSLFSGYRWEKTVQELKLQIPDSRSIKAGFDGTTSPIKWLSLNVMLDYQYRMYIPSGNHLTENLTIAGNVTVNW